MNLAVSIEVITDEEVGRILNIIKQILNDPDEADIPLYFSHPGRCLKMDPGESLIIVNMLRVEGYINISKKGIIRMTDEQMNMEYPSNK